MTEPELPATLVEARRTPLFDRGLQIFHDTIEAGGASVEM